MKKRIAIIGAGIAGLTLANRLSDYVDVQIFEKARGVGGRMSTRYQAPFTFDHGTQFFTVRDKKFAQFIAPYLSSGLIQEWKGKVITLEADKKTTDRLWFEPHYVACPGMNNLCKKMAENIAITLNCEVKPLGEKTTRGWQLVDKDDRLLGLFDLIISTAPPVQTCRLFDAYLSQEQGLRHSKLLASYTMMLGFEKTWDQSWIAAKIHNSPLEWIAVNSTKPGRNQEMTALVIHSNNLWAEEHVNDDVQSAGSYLYAELEKLLGLLIVKPDYYTVHRWRYALLDKAHDDETRLPPYFDTVLNLASVGDWGTKSRIEDVWLDAHLLANEIMSR
jgi:predicted NAD/FAD-dependent oxidoreductase